MKFKIIPLTSLFLLNHITVSAADQFQYVELTIVNVSIDEGSDSAGLGVEGKLKISDNFYANAAYQKLSNSDTENDRGFIGLGMKYEVNKYLVPFSQIDYVNINGKFKTSSDSLSLKQYRIGVGVAGSVSDIQYKLGLSRYFIEGNEVKDETIEFLEAFYSINNSFSVGGKAELADGGNIYGVGIRYRF